MELRAQGPTHVRGGAVVDTSRRAVGSLLLITSCVLAWNLKDDSAISAFAWVLAASLAGAMLFVWSSARGLTGAASAYLLVFGLFHCGLVFAVAVGGEGLLIGNGDNSWIYAKNVPSAIFAVCVAISALSVGVLFGQNGRSSARTAAWDRPLPAIALVGGIALAAGFSTVAMVLAKSGGFAFLFSGYGAFLESVGSDGAFGYGTILAGFGVGFLVSAGGRARRVGWVAFGVMAGIGLPLGLRGTVLFLAVAVLTVEAKRHKLPGWVIGLAAYAGFLAISVLRQTRADGLQGLLNGGWRNAVPLEAVAEMGYSLRPVVVVDQWLDAGVPPRNGATLIAPLTRLLENLVGNGAPPGAADLRLFNVEVMTRVGPIGGSPVAEGLRNGGPLFVAALMLIIGFLLARVDRLPGTPMGGAMTIVVMLPLLIAVRNSFAPILFQLAIGATMLLAAELLSRTKRSGTG